MFDLTSFLLLFFYIFVHVNVMFNLDSFLSLLLCTLIHVKVMLDINLVHEVGFDNLITFATYPKWKIHSLFQLQCKLEKEYLIMMVVVVSNILSYYNVIWDNVHHPFWRGKVFIMVIRCAFQEFFQYQVTTLHMILVALSCAFCVYFRFCDIMSWWIVKRMYINCIIKWMKWIFSSLLLFVSHYLNFVEDHRSTCRIYL